MNRLLLWQFGPQDGLLNRLFLQRQMALSILMTGWRRCFGSTWRGGESRQREGQGSPGNGYWGADAKSLWRRGRWTDAQRGAEAWKEVAALLLLFLLRNVNPGDFFGHALLLDGRSRQVFGKTGGWRSRRRGWKDTQRLAATSLSFAAWTCGYTPRVLLRSLALVTEFWAVCLRSLQTRASLSPIGGTYIVVGLISK